MLLPLFFAPFAYAEEAAPRYDYRGIAPEGQYTAAEIGAFLRQKPTASHEVRLDGWDDWRPANRVPEIVDAWLGDPVTLPPGEAASAPTTALVPVPSSASGDGGQAPRNAPAESARPASSPPAAEPADPAHAQARAPAGDGVRGLAELWLGATLDPSTSAAPSASLRRLAAGLEAQAGAVSARGYLGTADGAELELLDAWLRVQSGGPVQGWGRLGVARPAFGLADRLEDERRYWVAGHSQELERATGWLPEATLGLGGGLAGPRWEAGLEVADSGGADVIGVVDLAAVEARARGGVELGAGALRGRVGLSAAWRTGLREEAAPRLLGALDAELHSDRVGLVGQLVAGTEGDAGLPRVGGLALAAVAVPVTGPWVRQVDAVVGGGGWDATLTGLPEAQDVPDAWWEARAGANVRWATPRSDLITGLGYRLAVPQDLAVPLGHSLTLEAAWRY